MFTPEYREQVRKVLIERAESDPRVVAAALVGSSASGGDRWSDLDLTFGVAEGFTVEAVLADWTRSVLDQFDSVVLFDLPVGSTIYRVFLLPGALQVDLSFTPAAEFGARRPRFQLLFGTAIERPFATPPSIEHMLGMGVHHAVRAQICIERGRFWQANHWIHELRTEAMALACRRLGLDGSHARGFDNLPSDLRDELAGSLVGSLDAAELRRALAIATTALLREAAPLSEFERRIKTILTEARVLA